LTRHNASAVASSSLTAIVDEWLDLVTEQARFGGQIDLLLRGAEPDMLEKAAQAPGRQ
jgi:hypothetical protein